jgi:hypothetical protein
MAKQAVKRDNKEEKAAYNKEWHTKKRASLTEEEKESKKAYMREWKKENKDKVNTSRRASRKRNPDTQRASKYRLSYGITLEEYDAMFASQEGKCYICKVHQSALKNKLCVDHRHRDGKVRKLLCRKCNSSAGLMQENIQNIRALADYLEGYEYV